MQRQPLVIANWKLHGATTDIQSWCASLNMPANVAAALCPPFPYLALASENKIPFGAQNVSQHHSGAFTGEVSASMLKELGTTYALIGHSERRSIFNETDETVAQKVQAALKEGVVPVLCVGESQFEREEGLTFQVVGQQLEQVLDGLDPKATPSIVIAYEPVWAIGTGLAATPELADEVHRFIRNKLAKKSKDMAQSVQILYGGSVKPGNAADLAKMPDIDGALVGGASLDAQSFNDICLAFSAS